MPASFPPSCAATLQSSAVPSYAQPNRLNPQWVPGTGRLASAPLEPDCLAQPWMYASHGPQGYGPAAPRRRGISWMLWFIGLAVAVAVVGGYRLSSTERTEASSISPAHANSVNSGTMNKPELAALGLHAQIMLASAQNFEEEPAPAPANLPLPAESASQEGSGQQGGAAHVPVESGLKAPAMPAFIPSALSISTALPPAAAPAPSATAIGAREVTSRSARSPTGCSDAIVAMKLCGIPFSH